MEPHFKGGYLTFGLTWLTDFVVTYKTMTFTRQLEQNADQRTLADLNEAEAWAL
jgi:hypothetical protein